MHHPGPSPARRQHLRPGSHRALWVAVCAVSIVLAGAGYAGAEGLGGHGEPHDGRARRPAPTRVARGSDPSGHQRRARRRSPRRRRRRRIEKNTITLTVLHTGERVVNMPLLETRPGKPGRVFIRKAARRKLEHLARDWRTGKVHRGMPDALWFFLYILSYHFDAPVELISGYRHKERRTSRHKMGRAVDFRLSGVDPKAVWEYAKKRFTRRGVGLGYYPTTKFVHMDIREKSYFWIDDSGSGESPRYREGIPQPVQQWRESNRRRRRRHRRPNR